MTSAWISRRDLIRAGVAATAITAASQNPSWAAEAAPLPIRIGWLPGNCGRLYAAQAFKLFEANGLAPQLVKFNSGPAMNAAFQSSSIDVAYSGMPGFLVALGAVPMKIIAVENEADKSEGLVVREGSGIANVKDLPGKRIGTTVGTTAWMGLILAMQQSGVEASKVQIIDMKVNVMGSAFIRGDVDGIWIWAPYMFDLQANGGKLITLDADWYSNGNPWMGSTAWLEANREAAVRFVRAIGEATSKVETDRPKVAGYMAQQMGVSPEVATKLLDAVGFPTLAEQADPSFKLSMTNKDGGIRSILAKFEAVFTQHKLVRPGLDLQTAVDPSYLLEAIKKHV